MPKIKTDEKSDKAMIKMEDIESLELGDMVCLDSYKLSEITDIDTSFLDEPVGLWKFESNRDYQRAAADA